MSLIGGRFWLSVALLFWATRDPVLAGGFLAGLAVAATWLLFVRRLFPAAAAGAVAATAWAMLRQALAHEDTAIAITDRAARMVCANDLFATWFCGFVTPPRKSTRLNARH